MENNLFIKRAKTHHLRNIHICGSLINDSPIKTYYTHYKYLSINDTDLTNLSEQAVVDLAGASLQHLSQESAYKTIQNYYLSLPSKLVKESLAKILISVGDS